METVLDIVHQWFVPLQGLHDYLVLDDATGEIIEHEHIQYTANQVNDLASGSHTKK